jgi:hypothetical protein
MPKDTTATKEIIIDSAYSKMITKKTSKVSLLTSACNQTFGQTPCWAVLFWIYVSKHLIPRNNLPSGIVIYIEFFQKDVF